MGRRPYACVLACVAAAACAPRPDPAAVHRLTERSKVDAARYQAIIGNRGAYAADLTHKYAKIWQGLRIDEQIPTGLETPGAHGEALARRLETRALGLGLTVAVDETLRSRPVPKWPERVGVDEPIPWSPDALLHTVDLSLAVTPADLGLLERWFDARLSTGRLIEVRRVAFQAPTARIEASAFVFRDDLPLPRREVPPFDFEAIARAVGLPPPPRRDPPEVEAARQRYARLNEHLAEINEALRLRTEAERLDARYQLFLKIRQRCEKQRWLDVLR